MNTTTSTPSAPSTRLTADTVAQMIAENARRVAASRTLYDPILGIGAATPRTLVDTPWHDEPVHLPDAMLADPAWHRVDSADAYARLRIRYDFEYWCATAVTIRHKLTGSRVPFILNAPQRHLTAVLEADRLASRPLRVIMLKARQWGGSTLIQMYFAWIQCVHRTSWNSLICAHVKGTSATIRSMYADLLAGYPANLWTHRHKPKLKAVAGAPNSRLIAGRDSTVTIASSYSQDSVRGLDYSMAHLSEVAFWKDTERLTPELFVRAVCGGIPMVPCSFIALESTANGVGNYFHSEWLRAVAADKADPAAALWRPVFIPWYEIEMYRTPCPDPEGLIRSFSPYERQLWDRGLSLDMIQWYRDKLSEMSSHTAMKAEYPTDPEEAFANTGRAVFHTAHLDNLRAACSTPLAVGELSGEAPVGAAALRRLRFVHSPAGELQIWRMPDRKAAGRYVVSVDVGGRALSSDFSVIAVFDRHSRAGVPELVAQWRGHCDHDILAWKAAAIATWYAGALLVIESNSLESAADGHSRYILEEIGSAYPNLYSRSAAADNRIGFQTNKVTKPLIISHLIAAVRDGAYIEHSVDAVNEMAMYRQNPNGSYSARKGAHDDMLMTRAIALYIIASLPPRVPASFDDDDDRW